MRILIVSFYAEKHLNSSSAQNTRFLASALLESGYDVRVVCGSSEEGDIWQDGYWLTRVPVNSTEHKKNWLGNWNSDPFIKEKALAYFSRWLPDVIFVGAWGGLIDFPLVGSGHGIPIIQMVHDYSILCLLHWLQDSWGNLCTGPTSTAKCTACIRHSLGWKDKIKNAILSTAIVGKVIQKYLGRGNRYNIQVKSTVDGALQFMHAYRQKIELFIAQSPMVHKKLAEFGVRKEKIRMIPQYIGEDKLDKYPKSQGLPGSDRPLYIVFVGRWDRLKGADLLLNAFLQSSNEIPVELWVISHNADESSILAQSQAYLNDKKVIRVFNHLSGAAMSKQVAKADICVVPSAMMELASLVVLEAMAQKVPVIASSSVGNNYLINDGINGRIFPTGDQTSLQRCLEEVSLNPEQLLAWQSKLPTPTSHTEWFEKINQVLQEAYKMYGSHD